MCWREIEMSSPVEIFPGLIVSASLLISLPHSDQYDAGQRRCQCDPFRILRRQQELPRRHLTPEQKYELVAKILKAEPQRSDRAIGKLAKVDHKTVASVRRDKEGRGEIPHVATHEDAKGRMQVIAAGKWLSPKLR
jgi:hypothetical protein